MPWSTYSRRVSHNVSHKKNPRMLTDSLAWICSSIFINTALIQWAFTVRADPEHPIDTLAFTESANAHPQPFKVFFEPRAARNFEGIRELMEDYAT
jgi:hypothetical protein